MGCGTGTGAAPVIAAAARAKGILTVGVVTTPFGFEGRRRGQAAQQGVEALRPHVDTLIVIPNQNLFRVISPSTTFRQAFRLADEVLEQGVRSVSDLIVMPGLINLDFADVRTVMLAMGQAMLGTGEASGDRRASDAAERAIHNPLLDGAIKGARGLIISITGGEDMRLMEIDEAAMRIKDEIDPDANIIWGSAVDPQLDGRIRVSILATGMEIDAAPAGAAPAEIAVTQPKIVAPAPVETTPQPRFEPVSTEEPFVPEPAEPEFVAVEPEPVEARAPLLSFPTPPAGDYEVQISAPWEDDYAGTDTIVLSAPPALAEAEVAAAPVTFAQEAASAEAELILTSVAPAPTGFVQQSPEAARYQPPHRRITIARPQPQPQLPAVVPQRGPSLLQRLSMLARKDAGTPRGRGRH
jgi:cell division protein FtsZ